MATAGGVAQGAAQSLGQLGGYLQLAPGQAGGGCAQAVRRLPSEVSYVVLSFPDGHTAVADPNPWNTASGRGEVRVSACPDRLDATAVDDSASASRPQETVLGYPEVIYGYKPWGQLMTAESPLLRLPQRVGDLPGLIAYVDYDVECSEGRGDLAFDLWVTRQYMPSSVTQGDLEVMVWLYHDKDFTPMGYSEPNYTLTAPTLINGVVRDARWDVYVANPMGPGKWTYVAFTLEPPVASGSLAVPLSSLLKSVSWILSKPMGYPVDYMYLNGIEFGLEYTSRAWPPVNVRVNCGYRLRNYGIMVIP